MRVSGSDSYALLFLMDEQLLICHRYWFLFLLLLLLRETLFKGQCKRGRRHGVQVVNVLASISQVALHQVRLLLGWVTVC